MQIISGTMEFECDMNTAAAIGKFDGVHLGHRRLLDRILKTKADGLAADFLVRGASLPCRCLVLLCAAGEKL